MPKNEQDLEALAKQGFNYVPICREIIADIETPLSVYLKLAHTPYSYLFESVEADEKWGRYSIIGLSAEKIVKISANEISLYSSANKLLEKTTASDPLKWIETFKARYKVPRINADMPNFNGGLVGYFGYETIRYIEPKLTHYDNKDELDVPDILLMVSADLVIFDNLKHRAFLITHIDPYTTSYQSASKHLDKIALKLKENSHDMPHYKENSDVLFTSSFGEEYFKKAVTKIKKYITQGDVMQVVLSQRLSRKFSAPPINLYRALRRLNPSPYMYFLHLDDFHIIGSSPEILVRIEKGSATLRPLAGTRKRGADISEDKALEEDLLSDKKELAEHLMLIDLGRNDLGRIAKVGSVVVSEQMAIEKYSHVMHIVSNVCCDLREDVSPMDVLRATFPAGTLSGAPKVRAMEIIAELEPIKRNIYAGAIGYLSWHNDMDLAIAIRTAVIKNKQLAIQAGAGIVCDSKPLSEWQETMQKAQALFKAAENINQY